MIKKKFFLSALFIYGFLFSNVNAQSNLEFILRTNLGIGAEYKSLEFSNPNGSGNVLFSPGGGMGAEIGLGYLLNKNFDVYSTLGFQQNLALQYYSSNYGSDKTSFIFNRKSILFGVNYRAKFSKETRFGMLFGGGGSYNMPGKMRIIELNEKYGDVTLNPAVGFHLEAGLSCSFEKWMLVGSLRHRRFYFSAEDYNQPSNTSLTTETFNEFPEYIRHIKMNGVDLSISMIRYFNRPN